MVSLDIVQSSNSQIASSLPAELVAVFAGATNGVGETTLLQFAKYAIQPRVYFIGRSGEAGERILAECRETNPKGQFSFIKADTSLIRNVDGICEEIKRKESHINLLFISTGTLNFESKTSEGLPLAAALSHYTRARFIANLLPLLRQAPALRRVVSVFMGTYEGQIYESDFHALKLSTMSRGGHTSSLVTLSHEAFAKRAPEVSFIHEFPGPVKSGIGRDIKSTFFSIMKPLMEFLGPLINIPIVESGERHLLLATSARYPAREGGADGVEMPASLGIACGTDAEAGSGVYSINEYGESAGKKVEGILAGMRKDGMVEKVEKNFEDDFKRILDG